MTDSSITSMKQFLLQGAYLLLPVLIAFIFAKSWKHQNTKVTFPRKIQDDSNVESDGPKDTSTFAVKPSVSYTIATSPHRAKVTIVCISDTHGHHRELTMPKGDILIHAGDFTLFGRDTPRNSTGNLHENDNPLQDFNDWLGSLDYKYKIVVNGNHECNAKWKNRAKELLSNGVLLLNDVLEIDLNELKLESNDKKESRNGGNILRIYGMQFYWPTLDGNNPYHAKVYDFPKAIDILITHTPVEGFVDQDRGCPALRKLVYEIKPKIVINGHEHNATGIVESSTTDDENDSSKIVFVNAANAKGGIKNGHSLGKQPIILHYK